MESGTRLGPYEILEPLGAGGMGEVYLAEDTRLSRRVAIKVLPEDVASDRDRLERFEREARLLAQLNHANIATIHGLEDADGVRFIVMERVEGENLAERLAAGPLDLSATIAIGRQIADAFAAAHSAGIIHRDLKPANVMLTPEGKVKVLDFGLAKTYAGEGGGASGSVDMSASPTMLAATGAGVILGTAGYMSPEQARGGTLDRRTDIWSLGCVLFEMLAGERAFQGDTVSDTMAAILKEEPDWNRLPAAAPPTLARVVRRCLRKEPARRYHDAADVRIELEDALEESDVPASSSPEPARSLGSRLFPWAVAAVMTVVAVSSFFPGRPAEKQNAGQTRFTIPAVPAERSPLVFSPDGSMLAYVTVDSDGWHLYVRALDSFESRRIATADAPVQVIFFSPDSQWIGFSGRSLLAKVPVTGGEPFPIQGTESARVGADWSPDGEIAVQLGFGAGLSLVSADGGEPRLLTEIDASRAERHHVNPRFLPGGRALLFTILSGVTGERREVAVVSLETGERRVITQGAGARYTSSGHLVFRRRDSLMAAPFDPETLQLRGEPVVVVPRLQTRRVSGIGSAEVFFDVSPQGQLAYLEGGEGDTQDAELVWVDRQGNVESVTEQRREYRTPRISPDGSQALVSIAADSGFQVWRYDFARGTSDVLTAEGSSAFAEWSPDGSQVAFTSDRDGPLNVYTMSADGAGTVETYGEGFVPLAGSWSPDGTALLTTILDPMTLGDVGVIDMSGSRETTLLLAGEYDVYSPQFSPDGRWFAAMRAGSGLYLHAYPDYEKRELVASEIVGDAEPRWSRDGTELFFRRGSEMVVVTVDTAGDTVVIGRPRVLFRLADAGQMEGITGYDITPDGSRFLMVRRESEATGAGRPDGIRVVLNWSARLRELAPRQ
jgi:serine/threonine protein kinase